VLLKKQIFNS